MQRLGVFVDQATQSITALERLGGPSRETMRARVRVVPGLRCQSEYFAQSTSAPLVVQMLFLQISSDRVYAPYGGLRLSTKSQSVNAGP
jgi:hypothetical protein